MVVIGGGREGGGGGGIFRRISMFVYRFLHYSRRRHIFILAQHSLAMSIAQPLPHISAFGSSNGG